MTWQAWSRALVGSGSYAEADIETRLHILATMEERFLSRYYRIPLASACSCELLSFQQDYYTETYNPMYGFGGLRLLQYRYNDAEWEAFVASQGGELDYK